MTLIDQFRLHILQAVTRPTASGMRFSWRLTGWILAGGFVVLLAIAAANPGGNPGLLLICAWLLIGFVVLAALQMLWRGRGVAMYAGLAMSICLLLEMRTQPLTVYFGPILLFIGFGILAWASLMSDGTGLLHDWQLQGDADPAGWRGKKTPDDEDKEEFAYGYLQCGLSMRPPSAQMPRTHLWKRLGEVKTYRGLSKILTGDAGEAFLQHSISEHVKYDDFVSFPNKRIPRQEFDSSGQPYWGRAEMDLLVLTPWALFVYEVKNWNGPNDMLKPQHGRWAYMKYDGVTRQYKPKLDKNQKPIVKEDLVEYNEQKVEALISYLASMDIHIEKQRVINRVLMLGNIGLDDCIRAMPEVITRETLKQYLDMDEGMPLPRRACCAIMELCGNDAALDHLKRLYKVMPPAMIEHITWVLDRAGTWDRITLNGGRRVTGDILRLSASIDTPASADWVHMLNCEHRIRKTARLNLNGQPGLMESRLMRVELDWVRNKWLGMVLAWCKVPLGRLLINGQDVGPLTGYEVLKIHPAGKKPEEIVDVPLINIDRIEFG